MRCFLLGGPVPRCDEALQGCGLYEQRCGEARIQVDAIGQGDSQDSAQSVSELLSKPWEVERRMLAMLPYRI
jgi:hypothetical protein